MTTRWWGKRARDFLNEHLADAQEHISIATGFFSASGYKLLKANFDTCHLRIFVGYDERSARQLAESFMQEFLEELGQWHEDRYATVQAMADKLQAGALHIFEARAQRQDHAKIYIVDANKAIIGSINFTQNGLMRNAEGAQLVVDPSEVQHWLEDFDSFWQALETRDISGALLKALLDWLSLKTPWEVYLKAISSLLSAEDYHSPRKSYRSPAEYQRVVIKRALRQLQEHRGAMIVASTGLGKTVMGTHIAVELKRQGTIGNVLALCPKAVTSEWEARLESGEVPARAYTSNILDIRVMGRAAIKKLVDCLDNLDERWLVIIDESHRFNNRFKNKNQERLSFERLLPAIKRSHCYVLLLTATPFAVDDDNINNQLLLLPHTNPDSDGLGFQRDANAWRMHSVDTFAELPVATVFNTPYVAKNYTLHDEVAGADYITYPDGSRRYVPRLLLRRIKVNLPVASHLAPLLNKRLFLHKLKTIRTRYGMQRRRDVVENHVTQAWASSPWELVRVLRKVYEDDFEFTFITSLQERQKALHPVLEALQKMAHENDTKFMKLYVIVKQELELSNKIVIYAERHTTAGYLESGLKTLLPTWAERVACLVENTSEGWQLKSDGQQEAILKGFAPIANTQDDGKRAEDKYSVLIATDAHAEGINLQDSSMVISYDIAWTADKIIQRAGRVMRFWHEPRQVKLLFFTVDKDKNRRLGPVASRPAERLEKLEQRLNHANRFTEIPILPEDAASYESLKELSTLDMQESELELSLLEDPELSEVSSVLEDYTQLRKHRDTANGIPDDILSAFESDRVKHPTLVSILQDIQGDPIRLVYDLQNKTLKQRDDSVLELFRCDAETERAEVSLEQIERARYHCVQAWLEQQYNKLNTPPKHICSVLLVPPNDKNIHSLLSLETLGFKDDGDAKPMR